jgi:hypothetical protein
MSLEGSLPIRQRPESCLSDLVLDRFAAGELDGDPAARARTHLAGCALCVTRLAQLEDDLQQPLDQLLVTRVAARARRWRAWSLAAMLSAAALLAVWLRLPDARLGDSRLKGAGLYLQLIARRGGATHPGPSERLLPGATLAPGDAVRFRVSTARAAYLSIIGIDAAYAVSAYFPLAGEGALAAGREQLLDGSIILDQTLGPERMIAVACTKPLPMSRLLEAGRRALERAGGDPRQVGSLGLECIESSFLIEKVAPK